MNDYHFIVRFPFRLAPGQKISDLEDGYEWIHQGVEIRLAEQSGYYFISAQPFSDEAAAELFIRKLWSALQWNLIHIGASVEATLEAQSISYNSDPEKAAKNLFGGVGLDVARLDGILNGSQPGIYRSDKVVKVMTAGSVSLVHGYQPDRCSPLISEALEFPAIEKILEDSKLRTALDLYSAFFRESSDNSRLLTLTNALEVLAPNEMKPAFAQGLIDKWMKELATHMEQYEQTSEEWAVCESIKREIGFRREVSIRKRIRSMVSNVLGKLGDSDALDAARKAVQAYDTRSVLVHEGKIATDKLSRAIENLRDIVPRILRARIVDIATNSNSFIN